MADSGDLRRYESQAFKGATKEARINAGITQAVMDGYPNFEVAIKDLPYTANLVTFNNAVTMTCEAGAPAGSVNVRAYGADPNNGATIADSATAMQAAHNTGLLVYYPTGTYRFSFLATGMASGGIIGDGPGKSVLLSTDITAANLIPFTGRLPVGGITAAGVSNIPTFKDFMLLGQGGIGGGGKVAGAGIQIIPAAGESSYLHFENVVVSSLPTCIDFVAASLWNVVECQLLDYTIAGLQIANTNNADSSDNTVIGCVFNNPNATGAAILHKSSGSMRIVGNKMLGGANGYLMAFNAASNTGNLLIWANSIELMNTAALNFTRTSGTATFKNVVIGNNEVGSQTVGMISDASGFVSEVVVIGNVFNLNSGTGNAVGVTGFTDIFVTGNLFRGNGGTPTGVKLTSCTNGRVGPNTYVNLTTNVNLVTCTGIDQWDANTSAGAGALVAQDLTFSHAGTTNVGLQSTDAGADRKNWLIQSVNAGLLSINAVNDAQNVTNPFLTFTRASASPTGIIVGAALSQTVVATSEATLVAGIDARGGNIYTVASLTAARVVGAPTSPAVGQRITYILIQDGTGGRAVTWNAVFKVSWSDTGNTLNKRSSISFIYDGTSWNQDGAQTPYV